MYHSGTEIKKHYLKVQIFLPNIKDIINIYKNIPYRLFSKKITIFMKYKYTMIWYGPLLKTTGHKKQKNGRPDVDNGLQTPLCTRSFRQAIR